MQLQLWQLGNTANPALVGQIGLRSRFRSVLLLWRVSAALNAGGTSHSPHHRAALATGAASPLGAEPASSPAKLVSKRKRRLDEVACEQYPSLSRSALRAWILAGKVLVDGRPITKAGTPVSPGSVIQLTAETPKYVCRAGLKLEAALAHFGVEVAGLRCLDAGLSTGGFSDCLLQAGAQHIVGVDVGYGQVAERVRTDARVTVMERTNLRHLRAGGLPDGRRVQLVTLDLSFISILKVLPAVCDMLEPGGGLLTLIKPQFEAGRSQVGSGGVVRDPAVHRQVLRSVLDGLAAAGFASQGPPIESPIKGATSGNTEFLAYLRYDQPALGAARGAGQDAGQLLRDVELQLQEQGS